jgi:hypothetical protein
MLPNRTTGLELHVRVLSALTRTASLSPAKTIARRDISQIVPRITSIATISNMGQGSSSEHAHLTSGAPFHSFFSISSRVVSKESHILTLGRTDQLTARPAFRAKEFLSPRAILLQFRLPLTCRCRIRSKVLERGNIMSIPRAPRCAGRGLSNISDGQLLGRISTAEPGTRYTHT